MMNWARVLSILLLLIFSSASWGAPYKKPTSPPPKRDDITVRVPQSEIVYPESLKTPPPPIMTYFLELQISSWAPTQVIQPSYLPNTTDFKSSTPQFSLLVGSPLSNRETVKWTTILGLSYVQMQRSGTLGYDLNAFSVSQNMNLYQFQAGVEVLFKQAFTQNLHPLLRLSLNPTWSQAPASEFNNGISEYDWLIRGTAGLIWSFPKLANSLGLEDTAILLGAEATRNLSANDYSGTGLWIGTRLNWH